MKYINKIKDWIVKKIYRYKVEKTFKHLKKVDSKIPKPEPSNKEIADIYTKNILWILVKGEYKPYYYTYDKSVVKTVWAYLELDIPIYRDEGKIELNKNLLILN